MIREFAKTIDHPVPEPLKDLVAGFILGQTEKPVNEIIPMYPSGYALFFHTFGDQPFLKINGQKQEIQSRLILAGQICDAKINFHINGTFGQIGVILYPTANYYLFHKNGKNFLNTWRSLQETSPIDTQELSQNLAMENCIQKYMSLLIDYLKVLEQQRLPPISWLDECLYKIFLKKGNISQQELVEDAAVSERHFRRVFKKVIGLSPKYYCKIIQLASVFELLNTSEKVKLHHLALDCGYYDQSHFIRDFRKLIGHSPENFLNGKHAYLKTYMGRRNISS